MPARQICCVDRRASRRRAAGPAEAAAKVGDRCLSSSIAAVDVVGLGDDVVALGGGQEDRQPVMVLGACPCGRRARPRPPGASSRPGQVLHTWRKGVDPVPMVASTTPGAMALTLMPCLIRSRPGRLGQADDGRLGGAIDGHQASPRRPAWEAMLMIFPPLPRAIMDCATACRVKSVALHVDGEDAVVARLPVISTIGRQSKMAALLTRMSMPPSRAFGLGHAGVDASLSWSRPAGRRRRRCPSPLRPSLRAAAIRCRRCRRCAPSRA